MKETMRAAVLRGYHEPLQIEEKPIPVPGPGEVLVKVRASGLCVSDIHIQDGKIGTVHLPYTPGHEMAGVIATVGEGVDPARIGEHISAAIDIVCGECEFCRTGRTNLCRSLVRIGFERDGSHEEYCVIPAKNAFTVDPTIPFEEITGIPDAVGCMYNGLKNQAKLGIGQTLLILGVGGLGMNAIQIAKLDGRNGLCHQPQGRQAGSGKTDGRGRSHRYFLRGSAHPRDRTDERARCGCGTGQHRPGMVHQ